MAICAGLASLLLWWLSGLSSTESHGSSSPSAPTTLRVVPSGAAEPPRDEPIDATSGTTDPPSAAPALATTCHAALEIDVALIEALAAQHCEDYLAAARCVPPSRSFREHSGPQRMHSAAQHFLAPCELPPGAAVLDCNESPCLLLIDRSVVAAGSDCDMVASMRAHMGEVPEGLDAGERVWESTFMVHPNDRDEADEARALYRMEARFGHAEPWLQSHDKYGLASLPPSCDSLDGLVEAWDLGDTDAICIAALEHWGCREPDFAELSHGEALARWRVAELLDPTCATVSREDVHLSCALPPCTLTVPDDGSPTAGLCSTAPLPLWADPTDRDPTPVVTLPLRDEANAFERQAPFRVGEAAQAWRDR